jgi:hypothetical protein
MTGRDWMDEQDWGELMAIALGNLLGFAVCTTIAARLVARTRLPPWKVMIAALFLGHIAANLLRMGGGGDSEWSALGFTVSRLIGLPLLWFGVIRLVRRWQLRRSDDE